MSIHHKQMSKYSAIRRAIKEDYEHICQFCFEEFPANQLQIHHILRRRDGGDNYTDNLIPFCSHCHCAVHKYNYTHNSRGQRIMYLSYIYSPAPHSFKRVVV